MTLRDATRRHLERPALRVASVVGRASAHAWTWGSGNRVVADGAVLLSCTFDVRGNRNTVVVEPGAVLRKVKFFVRGDDHMIVIRRRVKFAPRGSEIWLEDYGCRLEIGPRTMIESTHFALTEPNSSISVGADCLFSVDVDVRTGDSHPIFDDTGARVNPAQDVTVGDRVWVGAHATILKGVTLLPDTVVGTGSVVHRSPGRGSCVLAGNPAAVVREGVTWGLFRDPDRIARGVRFRHE